MSYSRIRYTTFIIYIVIVLVLILVISIIGIRNSLVEKQKKVETINKLLDKLNNMLNKVNVDERKQILIYMEYLEMEYRKLENEFVGIKKIISKNGGYRKLIFINKKR